MPHPALPLTAAMEQRLARAPLLLFLDIDGTLSPIAPRPEDAILPDGTKTVLRELVQLPECHVVVITGRAAGDARRLVDIADVWLIGNHGLEIARPRGEPLIRSDVAAHEQTVRQAVERALVAVRTFPGVLVEDKRWSMTVHFRLAAADIEPQLEPVIASIGNELGLRVAHGKKVIELRPPIDVNKGTGALTVCRMLGVAHDDPSILCAGDDLTDEDAFRALRASYSSCVTVWVGAPEVDGTEPTIAEFSVPDPGAMCELLEGIAALRRPKAVI
jgi:trehalose 6-phosphate phosphatase